MAIQRLSTYAVNVTAFYGVGPNPALAGQRLMAPGGITAFATAMTSRWPGSLHQSLATFHAQMTRCTQGGGRTSAPSTIELSVQCFLNVHRPSTADLLPFVTHVAAHLLEEGCRIGLSATEVGDITHDSPDTVANKLSRVVPPPLLNRYRALQRAMITTQTDAQSTYHIMLALIAIDRFLLTFYYAFVLQHHEWLQHSADQLEHISSLGGSQIFTTAESAQRIALADLLMDMHDSWIAPDDHTYMGTPLFMTLLILLFMQQPQLADAHAHSLRHRCAQAMERTAEVFAASGTHVAAADTFAAADTQYTLVGDMMRARVMSHRRRVMLTACGARHRATIEAEIEILQQPEDRIGLRRLAAEILEITANTPTPHESIVSAYEHLTRAHSALQSGQVRTATAFMHHALRLAFEAHSVNDIARIAMELARLITQEQHYNREIIVHITLAHVVAAIFDLRDTMDTLQGVLDQIDKDGMWRRTIFTGTMHSLSGRERWAVQALMQRLPPPTAA